MALRNYINSYQSQVLQCIGFGRNQPAPKVPPLLILGVCLSLTNILVTNVTIDIVRVVCSQKGIDIHGAH